MFPLEELLNFDSFYNKEGDCDNAGDTTTETRHCSNDASKDNPESQEDGPPHMDSTSDRDISGQHDHQSHGNGAESHSRATDGRSKSGAVTSGSEGMQLDCGREERGDSIFLVPLHQTNQSHCNQHWHAATSV